MRTIDWIKSEGHTGVVRYAMACVYHSFTIVCVVLVLFRHLQADGWKLVSAADDKTLKVMNYNCWHIFGALNMNIMM